MIKVYGNALSIGCDALKKKKLLLIINPCAGKNSKRICAADVIDRFSCSDYECITKTTRCQGDATTIVKEYGEDCDLVVCCGGDGTLNETMNGVMKMKNHIPVGYIPCGSTNDYANTLGLPENIGLDAQLILDDKRNMADIGSFNGRFFSYVASFGVATDLAYSTPQKLKNILGHTAYMINGYVIRFFPMLLNFKPIYMKVEYDGGVIEDKFYFGSISNSTSVGGIFKLLKQNVKLNDGFLELFLVRGLKKNLDVLKILKKVKSENYDGEQMVLIKTKKVRITANEIVPWTLDGEFGGAHRVVEIEAIHNGIEVFSDSEKMFLHNNNLTKQKEL